MYGINNNLLIVEENQFNLEIIKLIKTYINDTTPKVFEFYQTIPETTDIKFCQTILHDRIQMMIFLARLGVTNEKMLLDDVLLHLNLDDPSINFSLIPCYQLAGIIRHASAQSNALLNQALFEMQFNSSLTDVLEDLEDHPIDVICLLAFYGHYESRRFLTLLLLTLIREKNSALLRELISSAYQLGRLCDPHLSAPNSNVNYDEACQWYVLAYSHISSDNPLYSDICYEYGRALRMKCKLSSQPIPQSIDHYITLIIRAAEANHPHAQFLLSEMYYEGEITDESETQEAFKWLDSSIKCGLYNQDTFIWHKKPPKETAAKLLEAIKKTLPTKSTSLENEASFEAKLQL